MNNTHFAGWFLGITGTYITETFPAVIPTLTSQDWDLISKRNRITGNGNGPGVGQLECLTP